MSHQSRGRKIAVIGLLQIASGIPALILIMIGQPLLATPFIYGAAIGFVGLFFNTRLGVFLSLSGGAAAIVLALLHPYPIVGGIAFGAVTAAAALTSRRGLHSAAIMVPIFTAFILVDPVKVAGVDSAAVSAIITGLVMTGGGLWVIGVARLLLGNHLPHFPPHPVGPRTSVVYAIVAGVILGASATYTLTDDPTHTGAWLLLSLLILLQPDPHDSWTKTLQRLGGTLLGALLAIPIIALSLNSAISVVAGIALLFFAFVVRYAMHRPYWQYVVPLTIAVILLDSSSVDRSEVAEDRVVATLVAGAITIVVALIAKALISRWERANPSVST